MNRLYLFLLMLLLPFICIELRSQAPIKYTSTDIHQSIKKLNVLGSVLYIAAHPDDENSRIISYFSNKRKMETTYLSLTRGDGGQNLIGPEIKELLGVIRTQELLAAREIDGGKQLFTRANDFGYSKSPIETMEVWNKEEVLSDVVFAIRKVQPDIIINRFSNNLESRTHGHHTASAVLSTEAFGLVNLSSAYPEHLDYVDLWQPQRLFFNTSWWFYGSRSAFEKADKSHMVKVNAGVYYPELGKSNGEIAAESRSMHKCQGMGSTAFRGNQTEYLEYLKGAPLRSNEDPFAGIDITWNRLENAAHISAMVDAIDQTFDPTAPELSIQGLLNIRTEIQKLDDSKWKRLKLEEVEKLLFQCAGLYIEAIATDYSGIHGEKVPVKVEIIKRTGAEVTLKDLNMLPAGTLIDSIIQMADNESHFIEMELEIPQGANFTNAYWLEKESTLGMYTVDEPLMRGLPETVKETTIDISLNIEGSDLDLKVPVVYKKTDPVKGEVYRPFEIIPPVSISPTGNVYVFASDAPREISFSVQAGIDNFSGKVTLNVSGDQWKIQPEYFDIRLDHKGQETIVKFQVTPPPFQEEAEIYSTVESNGSIYAGNVIHIEYDHIPTQMVIKPARSKIVRVDLEKNGNRIAYVMGAGDEIPHSLEQVGYDVTILKAGELTEERLRRFDAVILGIRAFNTEDDLKFKKDVLFDYASKGGNVIVQYNTSFRLVSEEIAPYQLKISRQRVSVEEAPVRFLIPDHPVLNEPNKITIADFDGWVQERGLYFAGEWGTEFEAILSSNDPGEDPSDGGLLIARHGQGHFIYTGYSWFRELPAGVPGAYRLFTNMISLGHKNRS